MQAWCFTTPACDAFADSVALQQSATSQLMICLHIQITAPFTVRLAAAQQLLGQYFETWCECSDLSNPGAPVQGAIPLSRYALKHSPLCMQLPAAAAASVPAC